MGIALFVLHLLLETVGLTAVSTLHCQVSVLFTLSSVIYTVRWQCRLHCHQCHLVCQVLVSFTLSSVSVIHTVKCQCHSHCQVSSGNVMYTIKCQVPGSVNHPNGLPGKYSSTLC